MIGTGLVAIAALVIGWLLLFPSTSSGGNVSAKDVEKARTAMTAAGCTFTSQPANPAQEHMSSADQKVRYDTFPPASGIHHPTPALLGNYRIAADPRQVVHVLEHGGIAIWTGPNISAKDRGALDAFYEQDSNGLIITPLEEPYPGRVVPEAQAPRLEDGAVSVDDEHEDGDEHRLPRHLPIVRREGIRSLPRRLPGPRPRALPDQRDAPRLVGLGARTQGS